MLEEREVVGSIWFRCSSLMSSLFKSPLSPPEDSWLRFVIARADYEIRNRSPFRAKQSVRNKKKAQGRHLNQAAVFQLPPPRCAYRPPGGAAQELGSLWLLAGNFCSRYAVIHRPPVVCRARCKLSSRDTQSLFVEKRLVDASTPVPWSLMSFVWLLLRLQGIKQSVPLVIPSLRLYSCHQ